MAKIDEIKKIQKEINRFLDTAEKKDKETLFKALKHEIKLIRN